MHIEIAVLGVEDALAAQQGGAHGVELLDNPGEGGLTPSAGKIAAVRACLDIEFNVIIRPRPRDFLYTDHELDIMKRDVIIAKDLGVDGVVLGLQHRDGTIDDTRVAQLIQLARPMRVTHHAAFDYTPDPLAAIDSLVNIGIDRILSAFHGGIPLLDNLPLYRQLIDHAGHRVVFMPGGLFTPMQAAQIKTQLNPQQIHCFNAINYPSKMEYRPPRVAADPKDLLMGDYTMLRVDEAAVRELIKAVGW